MTEDGSQKFIPRDGVEASGRCCSCAVLQKPTDSRGGSHYQAPGFLTSSCLVWATWTASLRASKKPCRVYACLPRGRRKQAPRSVCISQDSQDVPAVPAVFERMVVGGALLFHSLDSAGDTDLSVSQGFDLAGPPPLEGTRQGIELIAFFGLIFSKAPPAISRVATFPHKHKGCMRAFCGACDETGWEARTSNMAHREVAPPNPSLTLKRKSSALSAGHQWLRHNCEGRRWFDASPWFVGLKRWQVNLDLALLSEGEYGQAINSRA